LARLRLERLLEQENVKDLQFICITHAHKDHYHGLHDFLKERFAIRNPGNDSFARVHEFWDTGMWGIYWAMLRRTRQTSESEELTELLYDVGLPILRDAIAYRPVFADSDACRRFGEFTIRCLAPRANRVERYRHYSLPDMMGNSAIDMEILHEEVNDLSAVLAFVHNDTGCTILLGADATLRAWEDALTVWKASEEGHRKFSAVKVSHHGAVGSLSRPLYADWCKPGKTVAILSVGPNDPMHPHPKVVELLAKHRIEAHYTCRQLSEQKGPKSHLLLGGNLSRRRRGRGEFPDVVGHAIADIELRISEAERPTIVYHKP